MEEVCNFYKVCGMQWFLLKKAIFLDSFLLTYCSASDFICQTMLKAAEPSCKGSPVIRGSALIMLSASALASAEQQLGTSWNTSFDPVSSLLTTPRLFKSDITICCPPCGCSPNAVVLAVAPSLIELLHRLHRRLCGVESFIHSFSPHFRLRKFTKSFHYAVRKLLH